MITSNESAKVILGYRLGLAFPATAAMFDVVHPDHLSSGDFAAAVARYIAGLPGRQPQALASELNDLAVLLQDEEALFDDFDLLRFTFLLWTDRFLDKEETEADWMRQLSDYVMDCLVARAA